MGVGKTTLSRKLLREFAQRPDIIYTVIFEPTYENEKAFIADLIGHFAIDFDSGAASLIECKHALKDFLFRKGIEEQKTVVLLIDEAQKLSLASLEVLRGLLNYETNEYKLLQLVLLSQLEILPELKKMPNFLDRVNFKSLLLPLSEEETYELVKFRLKEAGYKREKPLFSLQALQEIYRVTNGYPRKITLLCHQLLKELVMRGLKEVSRAMVQELHLKETKILNVR